jgi:RNA polymerase sigma-70 factor (ECF subfamily)
MKSDGEILERIRQGDKEQFESLFRSSYVSLVRYAGRILKDNDDAEEIVQDLFVLLWKEREKLKIESSLNGYLFRSVHNRCLHFLDHKKVVERYARNSSGSPAEETVGPMELINYKELQDKITQVLKRLPEKCSTIFYLNRFEGLKYTEIAEKLSVSVKTVEANMGKALKEFRKELHER